MENWKIFQRELQDIGTVPAIIERQNIKNSNASKRDIFRITGLLLDIALYYLSWMAFDN
jgi:hypothetical protein